MDQTKDLPRLTVYTESPLYFEALDDLLPCACYYAPTPADAITVAKASRPDAMLMAPQDGSPSRQLLAFLDQQNLPALWLALNPNIAPIAGIKRLVCPVTAKQLLSEVTILLNRSPVWNWPPTGCFDPARMELKAGDKVADLTPKESQLLAYLLNASEPVPRPQLLQDIWAYRHDLETHTVETHIYRLRQKLSQLFGDSIQLLSDEAGYRIVTPS